ncbi:MAG: IS30 family transposase [Endomicrobium sp.]|nr:IS30 family transposase [Endomicrobium sp.]
MKEKGRITKTRKESNKALLDMFSQMPQESIKSITYDNGTENAGHAELNCILGTKSYFCQPYHSWEKGTVENTNGLSRRFFPKETNFDNIANDQIQQLEFWLNNRPRKCLGFKTSQEVFNSTVALAT